MNEYEIILYWDERGIKVTIEGLSFIDEERARAYADTVAVRLFGPLPVNLGEISVHIIWKRSVEDA